MESACVCHVSAQEALRAVFPEAIIRCQLPASLDERNEPEPDLLVAVGPIDRYDKRHPKPADILLLVEVADSSLLKDRKLRGPLYAEFGIPEYWILDLKASRLEIYREPARGDGGEWGYSVVETRDATSDAVPLKGNGNAIVVQSIIPG